MAVTSFHQGALGRPSTAKGRGIGVFMGDGKGKIVGKVTRSISVICDQHCVRGTVICTDSARMMVAVCMRSCNDADEDLPLACM